MPNTIAEYYTGELLGWNKSIVFYNTEMNEITLGLSEVIRRNSIVDIGNKVEAHQNLLNKLSDKLYQIQSKILEQQAVLKTNDHLIEDTMVNDEIEKQQEDLRTKMQVLLKEYIDVKFTCYRFISDTLKK
jgi:hypothetical protein